MKCTNALISEHKTILQALNVLDAMALRMESGEHVDPEDVDTLLRFLHSFADDHHQGKEETALFPELKKTAAAQTEPVRHLVLEHDQERSLVATLGETLRTSAGSEFAYFAGRLSSLLRTHIYKEEHILFETVEKALSSEQDLRVSAEFENIDALVKSRNRKALRDLRRLEWTYLRRRGSGNHREGVPPVAVSKETR